MCSILSSRRNRSQCHIACEELTCDLNVALSGARNSCYSHHAVFLSGKTLGKVVKQIIIFFIKEKKKLGRRKKMFKIL